MDVDIVQIRHAKPVDAADVAKIHDEAWRTAYQGIIPQPHLESLITRRGPSWWRRLMETGDVLLLSFDGQPQGYASIGMARYAKLRNAGEIYELYLSPPFQGIGLGKKLFLAGKRSLERSGLRGLVVWALEDNVMACDFYTRLGGKPCGRSNVQYGDTVLTKVAFHWR